MKSMTGYGSADGKVGRGELYIEIKSVNHRFCDISYKIPPKMGVLESYIRDIIQTKVSRGKVEIYFKEKMDIAQSGEMIVNVELARKYQKIIQKLNAVLGIKKVDINLYDIIDVRELISTKETSVSYEEYWKSIESILRNALSKFDKMRKVEGLHIKKEQQRQLNELSGILKRVQMQSKKTVNGYEARMRSRLDVLLKGATLDEQRVRSELAFLADKFDVAEELSRLDSHIKQYRALLESNESVGRSLDFLLQEMNREINTLGSKANDVVNSKHVVDIKGILEKMREQAQNIE